MNLRQLPEELSVSVSVCVCLCVCFEVSKDLIIKHFAGHDGC